MFICVAILIGGASRSADILNEPLVVGAPYFATAALAVVVIGIRAVFFNDQKRTRHSFSLLSKPQRHIT